MQRDIKFGYGFALVGIATPYLVDKLLGPFGAIIVVCLIFIGGLLLLIAGHHHDNSPIRRKLTMTVFLFTLYGAGLGGLVGGISGAVAHKIAAPQGNKGQTAEPVGAPVANDADEPRATISDLQGPRVEQPSYLGKNAENKEHKTAAPSTHSTPTIAPIVSAPNGIAIGGGTVLNPVVNNYGPPEARAIWQVKPADPVYGELTSMVTIIVDHTLEFPAFSISCREACHLSDVMIDGFGQMGKRYVGNPRRLAFTINQPRPLGAGTRVFAFVKSDTEKPIEVLDVSVVKKTDLMPPPV